MKNKLINLLIAGLIITLTIISLFTYKSYNKSIKVIQKPQHEQMSVISKETIINRLNLENSLNCLSGEIEVEANYSDKKISDDDVNFKWLKDKLQNMNHKTLNVDSRYKFSFTYDLKDLPTRVYNNIIIIQLSHNRLTMNQCELIGVQTKEEVGWFTSFTAQEVNSINDRTQKLAQNSIQADAELRQKAMDNVQADIKELLEGITKEDIKFEVATFDVVENNDVSLK